MTGMRFCSACAAPTRRLIPEGDDRERDVCEPCDRVFYENPRVVVGCLPVHEGRVLLCTRAIEPRYGTWTLPSGFLEGGETVEEGAARETWEEARARVEIRRLFAVYSTPHLDQVYLLFLARILEPPAGSPGDPPPLFAPGPESLETRLVDPRDIPWSELAFPSVEFALRRWVDSDPEDLRTHLGSHEGSAAARRLAGGADGGGRPA